MEFFEFSGFHVVDVFGAGEGGVFDFFDVVGEGVFHNRGELGVAFDEFWFEGFEDAEEVGDDDDFAVGVGTGADTIDGDGDSFADDLGDFGSDGFNEDEGGAGIFDGEGVVDGFAGGIGGETLGFEAAEFTGALGGESDVAEDDDAGFGNGFDLGGDAGAAFEFDGVGVGFLDEGAGVADGFFGADLVAEERHVADDKGIGGAATNAGGVSELDVHGHLVSAHVAVNAHADGIADEEHVHAGLFGERGGGGVVGGYPSDFFIL